RRPRRSTQKDGPMNERSAEARSVVVEREIPHPPEKVWRALTQPHLIEEWLMKNDFKPAVGHRFKLQSARRLGRRVGLRGPRRRVEQNAVLHLEFCARRRGLQSEKRGDFYAHSNEHGHPSAHGAVGLPDGSEAGLRGRQGGVAAVLCEARAGLGADRLKSTAWQTRPRPSDVRSMSPVQIPQCSSLLQACYPFSAFDGHPLGSFSPVRVNCAPPQGDLARDQGDLARDQGDLPRGRSATTLALLSFAMLIVSLDQYIVVVALPDIGRELGYSSQTLQSVISAYPVASTGFLLFAGRATHLLDPP